MKFQTKVVELARVPALDRNSGESHYGKLFVAFRLVALLVLFLPTSCAIAADYFVAVDGRDSNSGTSITEPLRTFGSAAQLMQPGDTCWIREGVYRETIKLTRSGQKNNPITFARYNEERVIIDGSDPVNGPWVKDQSGIWKTKFTSASSIEAIFCGGQMMMEARWPNCSWEENWNAEQKWGLTGKDSKLGVIESPELASSNVDLSGGLLYLRLSKGNNCFTRPITGHRAGAKSLEYDKTGIEGRAWNEDSMPERIKKFGFEQNRFFIVANGALDAAGEWWLDTERSELLFIPPGGGDPYQLDVTVKSRVAGFEAEGISDIVIEGIEFRGCNLRLDKCRRNVVRNCRFLYPSTPRVFPDGKTALETQKNLRVTGEDNKLERLLIEWAVDGALEVEGSGNVIENCIVHDTNLHGRHPGPAISVRGRAERRRESAKNPNVIRRCTVYNVGGVGIYAQGNGPAIAEYNHVFNAGLYCVDISSLYVPVGKEMAGTVVHHNWLHDISGIGLRVDIQGRGITVHHNLTWNVTVGCKLQGYQLAAYNNTVLTHDANGGFIVVFEPDASPEELAGWRVHNNVALAFFDRLSLRNDPRKTTREFVIPLATVEGSVDHNVVVQAENQSQLFVDPPAYDFRSRPAGPLAGKGVAVEGVGTANQDSSTSIGALEPNTTPWQLYDMESDPGQKKNIATDQPDIVKQLSDQYDAWFADISRDALQRFPLPVGHPEHNPVELHAPQAYLDQPLTFANGPGFANDWLTGSPAGRMRRRKSGSTSRWLPLATTRSKSPWPVRPPTPDRVCGSAQEASRSKPSSLQRPHRRFHCLIATKQGRQDTATASGAV